MLLRRLFLWRPIRNIEHLADLELVGRFKACQDNLCFEELFNRHWARMFQIACGILRDTELAEDIVQSTFERAYREIARFREHDPASSLEHWLARICRNLCLDELRKHKTRMTLMAELKHNGQGSREATGAGLVLREALEILENLQPRHRACYLLRIQGYSYGEIVTLTGYSFEEVKSYIRTARNNLVKNFEGKRA